MSLYAQVSDVRVKAPQITINATSKPSEGDVQIFLDEVEAELNAILANIGYVTPVAAAAVQARVLLRDLTATGALAKTLMARAIGVDPSALDAARAVVKDYRGRVFDLRQANDPSWLPDAEQTELAALKTPDQRSASFVDDPEVDVDLDTPRPTRAQVF